MYYLTYNSHIGAKPNWVEILDAVVIKHNLSYKEGVIFFHIIDFSLALSSNKHNQDQLLQNLY